MKRIVCTTLVVLSLAAMAVAQGTTSGSGFQLSTTPQRKTLPSAKTPEEGTAYQAIVDPNGDLSAAEAAAKNFEAKYPQSELGSAIYWNLTYRYQRADNAAKTVEMGRKVLQFDADNPFALVTVASVLSERTKETDLDREQRLAEATKNAQHALDTMEKWLMTAAGITDEQAQGVKPILASRAHEALGLVEDAHKNAAAAEKHYRTSVELNTMRPEAITWLRLALAQDAQKKYADALTAANRAVELSTPTGGMVADWAKQEQARLAKLTGQTVPAPATTPTPKS